ncbi:TraR/DksA family transcriptional regulator [Georgenia sp. Z1491]|uniref:TraR/DksA family transcriptional regulator n=1 Tax=Georgenia sp. Z1491 TaxID=3416707 RepID=UPI003CE8502E
MNGTSSSRPTEPRRPAADGALEVAPTAGGLDARRAEAAARLAEVEQELDALRSARRAGSDDDEHDPEGEPLSAQWSRLEGLRRMRLEALAAIDDALARRERGEGGRCTVCGNPIPPARLAVRPEATTCVGCAR